ncbi:hypothetical protein O181_021252 [Austropuccinia psidii MF-1]|uniref:OTU domain-containing protein n=1 Tax=Austropuccinia psidii MF-1 TaxID=1389203 RepID=A0A9Q3CD94_9BASI|nr:hypothetical protein [Austropuccinia psidii MF-1]
MNLPHLQTGICILLVNLYSLYGALIHSFRECDSPSHLKDKRPSTERFLATPDVVHGVRSDDARILNPPSDKYQDTEESALILDASNADLSDDEIPESSQHCHVIFGKMVPDSAKNFRFPTEKDKVRTQPLKAKGFEGLAYSKDFIISDGHCQFRALAYMFFENQEKHHQVREDIVNWMEKNPGHFLDKYDEDMIAFKTAISRMRDPTEWGNEDTLYAASQLFQAEIVVVSQTRRWFKYRAYPATYGFNQGFKKKKVGLFFRDLHYELLFKDPSTSEGPVECASLSQVCGMFGCFTEKREEYGKTMASFYPKLLS